MVNKVENAKDIDILKQKLVSYKQTLEALKAGEVVEEFHLTKKECIEIMEQVSNLEREISTVREEQRSQIANSEQQLKQFSSQLETVKESIQYLKQDVELLMRTVNIIDFKDLIKKVETIIDNQNHSISSIKEEKNELNILKEEFDQLKKQLPSSSIQPSNYYQLKQLIDPSIDTQPIPNSEKKTGLRAQNNMEWLQSKQYTGLEIHNQSRKLKRGHQLLPNTMNSNVVVKQQFNFKKKNTRDVKKTIKANNYTNMSNEERNNNEAKKDTICDQNDLIFASAEEEALNSKEQSPTEMETESDFNMVNSKVNEQKRQIEEEQEYPTLHPVVEKELEASISQKEVDLVNKTQRAAKEQSTKEDEGKLSIFSLLQKSKNFWK